MKQIQKTKKFGCKARIIVKEMMEFTDFKVKRLINFILDLTFMAVRVHNSVAFPRT